MDTGFSPYRFKIHRNPHATPLEPYGTRQRRFICKKGAQVAQQEIRSLPGYKPTPLVDLAGLARAAGIARIWYKDEGSRFGLKSFKAVGGAYAVLRLLQREIKRRTGEIRASAIDIIDGKYRDEVSAITLTCATDGNHGRAVAWGAHIFGCSCVIFIHSLVSTGRRDAIVELGARVVRVAGNYDDSVREAAKQADLNGWFVVADSGYEHYMEVPCDVMHGYTLIVEEIMEQLPSGERPTHTFIQAGCGGLAGAVCAHLWQCWEFKRPRFIVVEPRQAACLYQSGVEGKPVVVPGKLNTVMAGLACGAVSLVAWEILDQGVDDFMIIPDAAAVECMRILADGVYGDKPIVAGESAVGGLAGLLCSVADGESAKALGLDAQSRVLVIGTEGATDPVLYRTIVGRSAEEICACPGRPT